MTQFLPPNLLALFAPRDPIPYLPPVSKLPHEKKNGGYIGVGGFLKYFEVTKIEINFHIVRIRVLWKSFFCSKTAYP